MEIKEMEDYMDVVSVYDFAQTVPLFEQEDKPRLRKKLLERIAQEKASFAAAKEETALRMLPSQSTEVFFVFNAPQHKRESPAIMIP